MNPSEVASLFYFFIMKIAPDFTGIEMGIGHEVCVKAVSRACGKSIAQIRTAFKQQGDLGIVASDCKSTQKNLGSFFGKQQTNNNKLKTGLLFKTVFSTFERIAATSGQGSSFEKESLIVKLL